MNLLTRFDPYHHGMMLAALLLAGWILVCPWVVADVGASPAAWSFYGAGALAVLLCVVALMRSDDLAEYGVMAVAAWLVASPWVLDLSETMTRQAVVYGVFLGGLAWFGRPSYVPKGAAAT